MTRLADGPEVEVSTHIAAPVESVWPLITDINISARFQDEFQEAQWLDAEPRLGARFVGRNSTSRFEWETTSTIIAYEHNRSFGWVVNDPDDPVATWTFRIDSADDGVTLVYHRKVGPGPSGLRSAIERHPEREEEIIAKRDAVHREHMQAVVDGIKGIAEAG